MLNNQQGGTAGATASKTTFRDKDDIRRKRVEVVVIVEPLAIVVDTDVDMYKSSLRCIIIMYDRHNHDEDARSLINLLLVPVTAAGAPLMLLFATDKCTVHLYICVICRSLFVCASTDNASKALLDYTHHVLYLIYTYSVPLAVARLNVQRADLIEMKLITEVR